MRLGIAQIGAGTDVGENLALVGDAARRLHERGAELIVFPEYSMYEKKKVDATFAGVAEPVNGVFAKGLAALAIQAGAALVAGMVEQSGTTDIAAGGRPYNTILALDPAGTRVARYRKVHLFDSYGFRESDWIAPSPSLEPVTFRASGMTVAIMTCYDLRFPELARELVDAGAELLLVCSSWVPGAGKIDQWRVLARARAIENGCFVAAVSQTAPVSVGTSLVIGPNGEVITELGSDPEETVVSIDPAVVAAARRQDPALQRRRYAISRPEPR